MQLRLIEIILALFKKRKKNSKPRGAQALFNLSKYILNIVLSAWHSMTFLNCIKFVNFELITCFVWGLRDPSCETWLNTVDLHTFYICDWCWQHYLCSVSLQHPINHSIMIRREEELGVSGVWLTPNISNVTFIKCAIPVWSNGNDYYFNTFFL